MRVEVEAEVTCDRGFGGWLSGCCFFDRSSLGEDWKGDESGEGQRGFGAVVSHGVLGVMFTLNAAIAA